MSRARPPGAAREVSPRAPTKESSDLWLIVALLLGLGLVLSPLYYLHRAAFFTGAAGEIRGRSIERGKYDTHVLHLLRDGAPAKVTVPRAAYEACVDGSLQRRPFSLAVHCGGKAHNHWALLWAIPGLLIGPCISLFSAHAALRALRGRSARG